MTYRKQTEAFCNELEALLDRFADEFDLSNATVIGVLHLQTARITAEALEDDDEENSGQEGQH